MESTNSIPVTITKDLSILGLGKWALFCVQLTGYFPLASRKLGNEPNSYTYKFTWKSIQPYYSCLLAAASFAWCFMYFFRYGEFRQFIEVRSPTEVGSFNLMILTTTLSGIYMKIFGLKNGGKYQEFWEKTRVLYTHFKPMHTYSHGEDRGSPTRRFLRIASSCWFECVLMAIPVAIQVSYFYGLPIVRSTLEDIWFGTGSFSNASTQLLMGLGFWALTSLMHVGNAIWMNFFVKIYTNCLLSISSELRGLNKAKFQNAIDDDKEIMQNQFHEKYKQVEKVQPSAGRMDSELRTILDKLALVDHEITRFNKFFGNLLLVQVGNCVINLLTYSFFGCLSMGRGRWASVSRTVLPLFLHGKELLDQGTAAENLSAAAEKVLEAISEHVVLDSLPEELYLKIQILSVQLCTKPPIISARQFFTINRSLLTSVMSCIATFLVVLVQFKDQDDEDDTRASSSVGSANKTGTMNVTSSQG